MLFYLLINVLLSYLNNYPFKFMYFQITAQNKNDKQLSNEVTHDHNFSHL